MGRISAKVNLSDVPTLEDLRRFVTTALTEIVTQINGKLSFADNISMSVVTGSLVANVPLQIQHSLGRTPLMWIPGSLTSSANVWQTQPSNQTSLYLVSDADVTLSILVI